MTPLPTLWRAPGDMRSHCSWVESTLRSTLRFHQQENYVLALPAREASCVYKSPVSPSVWGVGTGVLLHHELPEPSASPWRDPQNPGSVCVRACVYACVRGVPWPQAGCMSLSLQVTPQQGPRPRGAARGLWLRPPPSWLSGSATHAGPGKAPSPTCCCQSSSWPWPWPCSW